MKVYQQKLKFTQNDIETKRESKIPMYFYLFLKNEGFDFYIEPTKKDNHFFVEIEEIPVVGKAIVYTINIQPKYLMELGVRWSCIMVNSKNKKAFITEKQFLKEAFKNLLFLDEYIDEYKEFWE